MTWSQNLQRLASHGDSDWVIQATAKLERRTACGLVVPLRTWRGSRAAGRPCIACAALEAVDHRGLHQKPRSSRPAEICRAAVK
jgi:hypothetical protein